MMNTYSLADRVIELICRYSPDVNRQIQDEPQLKYKIEKRLEADIRAIVYGIPSDLGDALWEKLEDAGTIASSATTLGVGTGVVELAGAIIERILLTPIEKKYYKAVGEAHETAAPLILEGYQLLTEIPVLDSILSMIPEKTIYAIGALVYDVFNIVREARRYNNKEKDYVEKLYGHGVE